MPTPDGPLVFAHPAFELVRNHDTWLARQDKMKCLADFIIKWGGEPPSNEQLQFDNNIKVLTKKCNKLQKQCMKLLRETYPDIAQPGTFIDRVYNLTMDWNGDPKQA